MMNILFVYFFQLWLINQVPQHLLMWRKKNINFSLGRFLCFNNLFIFLNKNSPVRILYNLINRKTFSIFF